VALDLVSTQRERLRTTAPAACRRIGGGLGRVLDRDLARPGNAAIIWLLFDIGLLESHSVSAITWIVLVALSAVLAVGVSWSHIWRRVTGQFNVEDVDD
jgi:hypothetical protein